MHIQDIEHYILENFDDIVPLESWGEKSFFLNPGGQLKRGTYFATIKEKDGDNDRASHLSRSGIFRLNIGVSKQCYLSLFQKLPQRSAKGQSILWEGDFTEIDKLLPHPIYAWMGWICVLNPSAQTFTLCQSYLEDAYQKAKTTTLNKLHKKS